MKFLLIVLVVVALMIPFLLFAGWITMLCLGALAAIFGAPVLAIGFWQSVLVSLILSWFFQGVGWRNVK